MVARRAVKATEASPRKRVVASKEGANYFASGTDKDLEFVSTGCCILDSVLGGGYVLGRIANLVGDKSTGKTLLAIEASANFALAYPDGIIRYAEAEAAFDERYAEALGMPIDRVQFAKNILTVEDVFEDIEKYLKEWEGKPCLYIIDSLDALSDRAEQGRKIDEGSYNMNKQKKLGEMFRRLVQKVEESRMLILIISQIRDKIGVSFGETKTRSGGKSLDFYASQVFWLSEVEKMKRTVDKVERITGVRVKARCKKNKIGLPFRECEFPVLFGYGIDDLTASVEWLLDIKREELLKDLGLSAAGYKIRISSIRNKGGLEAQKLRKQLQEIVINEWRRIETSFLPQSKKY